MKRDFTYIDDMVPAVLKALENPKDYEIYNLGGNQPVELKYFISLIEKELSIEAKKEFIDIQPGEVWETYAEIDKAKRELGFEAKTSIEIGIKQFVEWFKSYHK
jgi:UDP-glucuronate 4-epimerase